MIVKRIPDPARLLAGSPDDIRAAGWSVAVHNDYTLNLVHYTFWLFTKRLSSSALRAEKGEGRTDAEALDQVRVKIGLDPYFMGHWDVSFGGSEPSALETILAAQGGATTCTRPDHRCAEPGQGPCNGWPRKTPWPSDAAR